MQKGIWQSPLEVFGSCPLDIWPGPILHAIMSLHSAPSAKVWSLGMLSSPFPITNGTHQGCSLSLLIFALVIESLAQATRLHPHITELTVGQVSHKIGPYTDDIIIWLTDPLKSLPPAM